MYPDRRHVRSLDENDDYMTECLTSADISWSFTEGLGDTPETTRPASYEIILVHAFNPPVDGHDDTPCGRNGTCRCCAARQALESWAVQGVQTQHIRAKLSVLSFSIKETLILGARLLIPMIWELSRILKERSMQQDSPLSFLNEDSCMHQVLKREPHKILLMGHGLGNIVLKRALTNLRVQGCHLDPAGVFLFDDFGHTSETSADNYLLDMGSFFEVNYDVENTDVWTKDQLDILMVEVENDYSNMIENLYPNAIGHLLLGMEQARTDEVNLAHQRKYRYMYVHYKADLWQCSDYESFQPDRRKRARRLRFGEPEDPDIYLEHLQRFNLEVSIREALSEVLFIRPEQAEDGNTQMVSPVFEGPFVPQQILPGEGNNFLFTGSTKDDDEQLSDSSSSYSSGLPHPALATHLSQTSATDQQDIRTEKPPTGNIDWPIENERQYIEGEFQVMGIDQHTGAGYIHSSNDGDRPHAPAISSNSTVSGGVLEEPVLFASPLSHINEQPYQSNRDTCDFLGIDNYLHRGGFQTNTSVLDREYSLDEPDGGDKIVDGELYGDLNSESRISPIIMDTGSLAGATGLAESNPPSIHNGGAGASEEEELLIGNHEHDASSQWPSVQQSREDLISEALLELEHAQTHLQESSLDVLIGQIGKAIAIATPDADARYPGVRPGLQSLMVHLQNAQKQSQQQSQPEAQPRPWELHEDETDPPAPTPLLYYTVLFDQIGALRHPLPDGIIHSLELEYYRRLGHCFSSVSSEKRDRIHNGLTQRAILEYLEAQANLESTDGYAETSQGPVVDANLIDIDDHPAEALVEEAGGPNTENVWHDEFLQPPTDSVNSQGSDELIPELLFDAGNSDGLDFAQQEIDYNDSHLFGKQEGRISPNSESEVALRTPSWFGDDADVGDGEGRDPEGYALEENMQETDGEEEVDEDENFF